MESIPYDVVLLPEPDLANRAIQLSQQLKPLGVQFTLDNTTFFPHVSLYMLQLNMDGLKEAVEHLSVIADRLSVVELEADRFHCENRYIDIEYLRSREIANLQNKVINNLNPLRDGLRQRDKERLEEYIRLPEAARKEKEMILKFGYRSVGEAFHPHMTFTRFSTDQADPIKSMPPKDLLNGKFSSFGIFEMGENGTCIREVKAWKL